jgi:SAM-dependent methyltransferase
MSGEHLPAEVETLGRCLACGGRSLRPQALAYVHEDRRYPLVECRACGMRFLDPRPAPATLARFYDAAYFESDFRCGRSDATAYDDAAFRDEHQGLLDAFSQYGAPGPPGSSGSPGSPGSNGRLLDVGCATGGLLSAAIARGWQAEGVEISAEAAAHARARGLTVFQGDLIAARFPDQSFDLVYMGDVLEHVPDCRAVVDEVARVLRPGGRFYLRGPITTHSLARGLALAFAAATGRTLTLHEVPYHLWEFTPGSLTRLVERAGLRVEHLRQSKIPLGHAHGRKSAFERAALAAFDAFNLPLTALFNVRGDRVVLVARKG